MLKFLSIARRVDRVHLPRLFSSTSVEHLQEKRILKVAWADGESTQHPVTWLRDNCQCPKCYNAVTANRTLTPQDLEIRPKIDSVRVTDAGVEVTWDTDHTSSFDEEWLKVRSFTKSRQENRNTMFAAKPQLWRGPEVSAKRYDYNDLMSSDRTLLKWIIDIETLGFAIINNAPAELKSVEEFAKRISYPSMTHYGPFFQVRQKEDPSNTAYLPIALPLHTDLPYSEVVPSIQLLHCVEQNEKVIGGDSLIVDGFEAARQLKEQNPAAFEVLANTFVDFFDHGTDYLRDFHTMSRHKTIECSADGEVNHIVLSNHGRDSFFNIDIEMVQPFYEAYNEFQLLLRDEKNIFEYRLETGDISCFDNRRILHGRRSYSCLPGADRFLNGCYVEWTETHSKRRRLQEKFKQETD